MIIIGMRDGQGVQWYLSRAASIGNLMRTRDPLSARTWPSEVEFDAWAAKLPEKTKEQLAGRELYLMPIAAVVGEPTHRFTLVEVTPAEAEAR